MVKVRYPTTWAHTCFRSPIKERISAPSTVLLTWTLKLNCYQYKRHLFWTNWFLVPYAHRDKIKQKITFWKFNTKTVKQKTWQATEKHDQICVGLNQSDWAVLFLSASNCQSVSLHLSFSSASASAELTTRVGDFWKACHLDDGWVDRFNKRISLSRLEAECFSNVTKMHKKVSKKKTGLHLKAMHFRIKSIT